MLTTLEPAGTQIHARAVSTDFMTLDELGQRMGLGKSKIYSMAASNTLPVPVFKIGRTYRVSREAYRRWLEGETR